MENPFFRNHWNYYPQRPRYGPATMEIPATRRTVPVAPKMVSIPVRFVESKNRGSDSATKIQKVFRGFLVRKIVKKVVAIERDVDEIERRIADRETVDLIRKDAKERVKYGEMLMSLLFRLDSVKGVDSGVRNFRKAVIKKAIALQEKIDSIAAAHVATDRSSEMNASGAEIGVEETPELKDGIPEHEDESSATDENANPPTTIEDSRHESMESNVDMEVPEADDLPKPQISDQDNSPGVDELAETVAEAEQTIPEEVNADMLDREIEATMSEDESQKDLSNNPPNSEDGIAESGYVNEEVPVEEDIRMNGREEEGKKSRELLERMMVDNKKAMEMMAQLVEKNELQSRMLSSLSQRVEQLEKALVYEMLRKKKRRNCVDCSEKSPKTKKSGK